MTPDIYDLAVIGGGLTGTAIARDAAGRGLSVFLAEAHDIGDGASSATGGLVCGPLDRLRSLELRRLRSDADERAVLMRAAPHVVQPLRFLIPAQGSPWHRLRLRLGLYAIDRATAPPLNPSTRVDLDANAVRVAGAQFSRAAAMSDCFADDSRLAVLNAVDARIRGATVRPRVRCSVAERDGDLWRLSLEPTAAGSPFVVSARVLVNASGSAVAAVNNHVIHTERRLQVRLVKRAYIAVRLSLPEGNALALARADGSFVYVAPIAPGVALVGPHTTELDGAAAATVDSGDAGHLLDAIEPYLGTAVGEADIVSGLAAAWSLPVGPGRTPWSVEIDAPAHAAPAITPIGVGLMTHRQAAESVLDAAGRYVMAGPAWTAEASLPGGGFPAGGLSELARAIHAAYRFIGPALALRLARAYGTRAQEILLGCRALGDLGRCFGSDLTEVEVNYLRREEWAETAEDILWRRTKLGFSVTAGQAAELDAWIRRNSVVSAGPVIP